MKHLKMAGGLLTVAALSLLAFAASADATPVLTSPAGVEYTGEVHWTLATPDSSLLKLGIEETCGESTLHGHVTTNNETHAIITITSLTFGDCEGNITTNSVGTLTVSDTGVVTAIGTVVTFEKFGISCAYGGGTGTKLGTLTTGKPAVLNVSTTELPKIEGGIFCANKASWTARYTITTPGEAFFT